MLSFLRTHRRSPAFRYSAAVLGVAVATVGRLALTPLVGNRLPFVVFFLAMVPIAWDLGVGPSLLAILLATLAGTTFFIPPFHEVGVTMVTDLIGIALFVLVNLVIVMFAEANRVARRRLEAEVQERVRAEATIREQMHRAEFARDIDLALTSSPSLAAVLDRCVGLTVRHLGGDRARIITLSVPAGLASDQDRDGPHDDQLKPEDLGRGLIGRIAAERRPHLTNRLNDDSGSFNRNRATRDGMLALAGCPLVVEDRLVGVWLLFSRTPLGQATLEAMESAASSLALGIERKRAEEELRIGEARKTAILETSLDGIITMDHRGRVVEFNPAAERIFGHSALSIQGRELAEIVMPGHLRSSHRQGLAHYLTTGEGPILNRRIEVSALRADGAEFPAEITVARIPIPGPPLFTAHIRDISDRTRNEEALRSAKRDAEDANQAKDRFIAVLSHELRTPLNPISLTINSILGKTAEGAEGNELRHDLELIRHYVGIEARLIDDLLDVMRIVRGKMPLLREVVDAHQLIQQAVTICGADLEAKHLHLDLDLEARNHAIHADANRVCQVFWNLIKNAVKFTPGSGSVTIRTRNAPNPSPDLGPLEPDEPDRSPHDLIIEVVDTGIGIEPEVLPGIFEAFQQGDSSIVRQFGGLGLGLAICQGVVEGHGGTLTASSIGKDRGSTFTVRLRALANPAAGATDSASTIPREFAVGSPRPVATHFTPTGPVAGPAAAPTTVDSVAASLQVLLVEDEPATIRLMSRLLRGLGYQVTAAESVAEAAEHVAGSQRFDLIVSDIGLPDGTGHDLMRQVRATRGELPGIALTGFGTEEDIEQSRQSGFAAHMTKPIDFNQLESLIRLVVGPSAGVA